MKKTTASFIWSLIAPYKWYFIGMAITGILYGVQISLGPYLLKRIIDAVALYSGDKKEIFRTVQAPVVAYILVFIVMAFNFRITDWLMLKAIPGVKKNIFVSMFSYLKQHSYSYFQNHFAGSLVNKIHDMSNGTASVLQKLDQTFACVSALVIACVSMFFVHAWFAAILLSWAFIFIFISLLCSKKIKYLSHAFSTSKTEVSGKIVDSITNAISSKLFAHETFEVQNIRTGITDTLTKDRTMQSYILKMRAYQDISIVLLMASMLCTLVIMYSKEMVTIGDFAFILLVASSIFQSIFHLSNHFVQFAEDLGKCAQAVSIVNEPHGITDIENAKPIQITQGMIEFHDITFHYNANNSIFKNKSVIIKPGTKTGLVGFSGSGKTTFVNLILRLFDVESGYILIDGQNIARVTQDSLHKAITMIPQDISLFHRSLMDNIRYGNLDATDDDVIAASKRAHCHEFITLLTEGYHSLVGERGIKLSGGQRQRIAIARAMLKNAPILILDEATSALDSMTEKHIQDSLHRLMKGRTTIVIAHRLSTLLDMDTILVFHQGQIIEQGSHQELLAKQGHYATLWSMQVGGFLPDDIQ